MDLTRLYRDAVVIDATCPLLYEHKYVEEYKRGGHTLVLPTLHDIGDGALGGLRTLAAWHHTVRKDPELMLVRSGTDIAAAKAQGKLGVSFHFQGADPIENRLDYIDAYKQLGVGMIQLTYNVRNRLGDGCTEASDAGLSAFGRKAIRRMNDVRVVVDCSHTGQRTSLEAIEHSSDIVVVSHACAYGMYASERNVRDELIKAIAGNGGVIGIAAVPFFLSDAKLPSIDNFIDHIAYVASLVGMDHVALGMDYYNGQHPYCSDEVAMAVYQANISKGRWSSKAYPPPPYIYPESIETPDKLASLPAALMKRGFSEADVLKVLGANWARVFNQVWGV